MLHRNQIAEFPLEHRLENMSPGINQRQQVAGGCSTHTTDMRREMLFTRKQMRIRYSVLGTWCGEVRIKCST